MKQAIAIILLAGLIGYVLFQTVTNSENTNNSEPSKTDTQIETPNKEEQLVETGLTVGSKAPDFTLSTVNGDERSLSDYRGKKVILNFWATWCPPCKAEMPEFVNYMKEKEEGVEIVTINLTSTERDKDNITKFINDYELNFPVLLDEENVVGDMYRVISIPTTYFIDSEGLIQYKFVGPMTGDQLNQIILTLE